MAITIQSPTDTSNLAKLDETNVFTEVVELLDIAVVGGTSADAIAIEGGWPTAPLATITSIGTPSDDWWGTLAINATSSGTNAQATGGITGINGCAFPVLSGQMGSGVQGFLRYDGTVKNTVAARYMASVQAGGAITSTGPVTNWAAFSFPSIYVGAGATADNVYGLFLGSPAGPGAAGITNRYGIYQEDALAKNFLKGSIHHGVANATYDPMTSGIISIPAYEPNWWTGRAGFLSIAVAEDTDTTDSVPAYYTGFYSDVVGSKAKDEIIGGFFNSKYNGQSNNTTDGTIGVLVNASAAGPINYLLGVQTRTHATNTAGVVVGNMYGFYAEGTIGAAAAVTNYYGLYLSTMSGAGTITNRYGIYQSDAAAKNVFNGQVEIDGRAGAAPALLIRDDASGGGMQVYGGNGYQQIYMQAGNAYGDIQIANDYSYMFVQANDNFVGAYTTGTEGWIEITTGAAPAASADRGKLYVASDGSLHYRGPTTDTQLAPA